eukprot:359589-Chlamydomonas_euryale.AAC.2
MKQVPDRRAKLRPRKAGQRPCERAAPRRAVLAAMRSLAAAASSEQRFERGVGLLQLPGERSNA